MGVALGSLIYPYLPQELLEQMPEVNKIMVLTLGGTSGVLGGSMLTFSQVLKSSEARSIDKFVLLTKNYLSLEEEVKGLRDEKKRENDLREKEVKRLNRIEKLLEVDLKAKLSNKFLEGKIKEEIEGALNEKE